MKLASYRIQGATASRVGMLVTVEGDEFLADLTLVYADYLALVEHEPLSQDAAALRLPPNMLRLLEGGDDALATAKLALSHAQQVIAEPAKLAAWQAAGVVSRLDSVRFLPPVPRPGKIISVGMNYRTHVSEVASTGLLQRPAVPVAFAKFPSVLIGSGEPILYPRHSSQLDYEGELCIVIGRRCKDVPAEQYLDVVAGFTICNDVSMRDIQFAELKGGILTMGKNLDTSGPIGPYLVTKDDIPDPQNLQLRVRVNGELRQDDNTRNMIFSLGEIVSYWSRMTLEPGDVFTTGTPAGVGVFRDPPDRYLLHPGDVVEVEIQGLGVLRNQVLSEEDYRRWQAQRGR